MDLNKVILVGRVTADPQVRTTPGGQSVTTIGVATNRTWTDKQGQQRKTTEVMAERMQLGPRPGNSSSQPPKVVQSGDDEPFISLEEDEIDPADIPF